MVLKSKKELLLEFFNSNETTAIEWYRSPIAKLQSRSPYEILASKDVDFEAIDFLFRGLESGVFLNHCQSKSHNL